MKHSKRPTEEPDNPVTRHRLQSNCLMQENQTRWKILSENQEKKIEVPRANSRTEEKKIPTKLLKLVIQRMGLKNLTQMKKKIW